MVMQLLSAYVVHFSITVLLTTCHCRFPGGECYRDVINRLETVIIDVEQQVSPVLVVSHVSVLQTLIAYFRASPVEK